MRKAPYYIHTPAWTHISSGVRALHILCDALNRCGEKAYLFITEGDALNPNLDTPVLLPEYANYYARNGIDPIVVYPDIVVGNPLNAKHVVRYFLAPPRPGQKFYVLPDDMVWGYTTEIAGMFGSLYALTAPTIDRDVFFDRRDIQRSGTCFYSHKYDRLHGNPLLPITNESTRLEGSPRQIASILNKSERCYVYEMTEAILCAQLCGCPVEIVQTEYFNILPDGWPFPSHGIEPSGPDWQSPLHQAYSKLEAEFMPNVFKFIWETQGWATQ